MIFDWSDVHVKIPILYFRFNTVFCTGVLMENCLFDEQPG